MKSNRSLMIGMTVLLTAAGCQTLSKVSNDEGETRYVVSEVSNEEKKTASNPIQKLTKKKPAEGNPESIVAIWKDATYTVAGQRPTRGFGGRLYFHDRNDNPVLVDGDLIVYGFKDAKTNSESVPEKRFIFTREELQSHMSVSAAGPSYSVWLPWDHINGDQKNVTIIAVFKDALAGGRVCKSEAIPAILPGNKTFMQQETNSLVAEIQKKDGAQKAKPVGFEQTKPEGTKKIKTHEIRLPEGSKQRLFGRQPSVSYKLPEPKVMQASAIEPIPNPVTSNSPAPQPSADSLPDQRRAQIGQFVRQGKLPPGSKPPLLGAKSSLAVRR